MKNTSRRNSQGFLERRNSTGEVEVAIEKQLTDASGPAPVSNHTVYRLTVWEPKHKVYAETEAAKTKISTIVPGVGF